MPIEVGNDKGPRELREVYLPARVLNLCLPGWEQADDAELTQAVGAAMEHGYWHWRWLAAVREHKCRLMVVQHRDVDGKERVPQYQIGEMFTLSGWHPERALIEAQNLFNEGQEGLTFDLPVDEDLMEEWDTLADLAGLHDADLGDGGGEGGVFDLLIAAMILLDDAHDRYVGELGETFYVATRGLTRNLDRLLLDEFGRWSNETMQIYDRTSTVGETLVYPAGSAEEAALKKPVPLVYPPEVDEEALAADMADEDRPPVGSRLN